MLDTKQKRGSAIGISLPFRPWLSEPTELGLQFRKSILRLESGAPGWTPTIGDDYNDSIDGILNPSPSGDYESVLSTYDLDGTSVWNDNLFGGGGAVLDFSGVQWCNQGAFGFSGLPNAVAITKRHIIGTEHGAPTENEPVTFVGSDGISLTRNIIDVVQYVGHTEATQSFRIMYLDADLPDEVAIYPILADRGPDFKTFGWPIIKFNQDLEAHIDDVQTENLHSELPANTLVITTPPIDETRLIYHKASTGGDSGSVAFVLIGTQLIYCGSTTMADLPDGNPTWLPSACRTSALIKYHCKVLDDANAVTGYQPTRFRFETTNVARAKYYYSMMGM